MRNEEREVYKASKTIDSRLGKEQIKFIPLNTNDRYFEKLLGLKDVDIPDGQNTKHFTHEKIEKRENYPKSIEHRVYRLFRQHSIHWLVWICIEISIKLVLN